MKSRKILVLTAFAAVVVAFFFLDLGKYLTLESLKANKARLSDLRDAHAFLFAAIFVLIYVVQTTFSLPGIGQYAYIALTNNDLPKVLGVTLIGAFFIIIANLVVDVLYAVVDPRVRIK